MKTTSSSITESTSHMKSLWWRAYCRYTKADAETLTAAAQIRPFLLDSLQGATIDAICWTMFSEEARLETWNPTGTQATLLNNALSVASILGQAIRAHLQIMRQWIAFELWRHHGQNCRIKLSFLSCFTYFQMSIEDLSLFFLEHSFGCKPHEAIKADINIPK